ncbi:hypothetical protein PBY51_008123 [Eleginops maclovinus]|uniref:CARD domain-containing protein n=1 Tax=Eleginops maclovinus TaxID=56733 RepID=A0AAN7X6N4_ELEMC|nr:hypothetical protein PBY51_008123 [Eleginops maclovinus]
MGGNISTQKKKKKKRPWPSPRFSSTVKKNREAEWVDNNRSKFIQNVTLVMPVADELLAKKIIRQEMYANIECCRTTQDQMRAVYKTLTTTKAKCTFYRIINEHQPELCENEAFKKSEGFWKQKKRGSGGPAENDKETQGEKNTKTNTLDKENSDEQEPNILVKAMSLRFQNGSQMQSNSPFNGLFSCGRGGQGNDL